LASNSELEQPEGGAVAPAELAAVEEKTRLVLRLVSRRLLRIILVGIVLYFLVKGALWVVYALTGVLLLIVLSVFFAYLIAPLVEMFRRPFVVRGREREMPRLAAIAIVYVGLFGSLFLVVQILSPLLNTQLADLAEKAPQYLENSRLRAARLNEMLSSLNLPPAVREWANKQVSASLDEAGKYVKGQGFAGAVAVLSFVPWLVLIPILAFFFLKDADSFRRSVLQMLPQGRLRWRGDEFFQDVNSTLAAYIRAQLIACLLIGAVCTVGFYLIGVPYALVLGVAAGFLEFIPLLGPLVVALMAVVVASFYSGNQIIAVLLFLGILRVVHDYYTYPKIIGQGVHLHPLAVILAILAGHEVAGVAGIFLAIPVIAILTVSHRHWLEHRGSTGLVADILKPAEQAVNTASEEEGEHARLMEEEVSRNLEEGEDAEERPAPDAEPEPQPAGTK
jgi:predicted PurR-regulated permease PerM